MPIVKFLKKQLAQHSVIFSIVVIAIITLTSQAVAFGQEIFVTRLFTPAEAGKWGLIYGVVLFARAFTDGATPSDYLAVKSQDKADELSYSVFVFGIFHAAFISVAVLAIGYFLGRYFDDPSYISLIAFIAFGTFVEGFKNVGLANAYIDLKPHINVIVDKGTLAFALFVTLTLLYVNPSIHVLLYGVVLHKILLTISSYSYKPIFPKLRQVKGDLIWKIAIFNFKLSISVLLVFLLRQGGRFIVGGISTVETVAFFSLAYTMSNFGANIISFVVNRIFFSIFATNSSDIKFLKDIVSKSQLLLVAVSGLMFIGLNQPLKVVVATYWSSDWMPVQEFLLPLTVYAVLRVCSTLHPPLFKASDIQGKFNLVQIVQLAYIVLIVLPLSFKFGVYVYVWAILGEVIIQIILPYFIFPHLLWDTGSSYHILLIIVYIVLSSMIFSPVYDWIVSFGFFSSNSVQGTLLITAMSTAFCGFFYSLAVLLTMQNRLKISLWNR